MKWLKKINYSQLIEDIANGFDPYHQETERILAIEKLNSKQGNNKENKNEPLGKD